MNIRKGDIVQIMSGEDKGKKGKVLVANPSANKVLVEGINVRKKHTKPRKAGDAGGIKEQSLAINVSKTMIICNKCKQPTRVGHTILKDGTKVRSCKKCNETLETK